jgi:hypothetical protein
MLAVKGRGSTNGDGVSSVKPELPAGVSAVVVREELDRILSSPLFSKSKRYPAFLRYVVEQTIDGHTDRLKEKTIGTQVLGRPPDYDSDADPIVRVTAGEIRKRLAEYYLEPVHAGEIRINIPPGSYLPQVHLPAGTPATVFQEPQPPGPPGRAPARFRFNKKAVLVSLAAVAAMAILLWQRPWAAPAALDRFWAPLADPKLPLTMGLPHSGGAVKVKGSGPLSVAWADETSSVETPMASGPDALAMVERRMNNGITPGDAVAFAKLVGYWAGKGHTYSIRIGSSLTLADLTQGPALLLGAYNNEWTLRLRAQGRFRFAREPGIQYIADQQNPAKRDWARPDPPPRPVNVDYGLVTRVVEPSTGRIVMFAGGLGTAGTGACADILTDPKYLEAATRQAPRGWHRGNIQVVVSVRVINGSAGQPQAVATYFW